MYFYYSNRESTGATHIPSLSFTRRICTITSVTIYMRIQSFVRNTRNKVSNNKSDTSHMSIHSSKMKSCSASKVVCSRNLVSKKKRAIKDNHNTLHQYRRLKIQKLTELTLHLKSRRVCRTSQCPYRQACINAVFKHTNQTT